MLNRVAAPTTFASTSPPWSLALLDANFANLTAAANDSSLGWMNGVPNDTGTVNNCVVTLPYGAPSGYNPGFSVTFIPAFTNTGASTINVNVLGPVPIVDVFGNPLMAGLLVSGKAALVQYTGSNFRLLTASQSGGVSYYYDYDDFLLGAPIVGSGTTPATGGKLLTSWIVGSAQSGAITGTGSGISGHPGLHYLSTSGVNGVAVLAAVGQTDPVSAAANGGFYLDGVTNILLRSILEYNQLGGNVDVTFGLWSVHASTLATGGNQFLGFVGNLNRNANWLAWANSSNTAISNTSTGVAIALSTWYTLEFYYTASTGVVTFLINGTQVATISTNLPSSTICLYPGFQVVGLSATISTIYIDTFELVSNPGTPNRFLYGAL